MFIQPFPSGPLATNCYIIACPQTRLAAIIDPAPESAGVIFDYCSRHHLMPEKILLTHSHWDHIADVAAIQNKYQIPVYIHQEDAYNLIEPGSDGLPCWIDITGVQPHGYLKEGDPISVGNVRLQVIHTPGHTPGCVCFYSPTHNILISGDTLFKGGMGNLSLPTARPALMPESLKKLSRLPPETVVYPGHGPRTTIGSESWLADN